MHGHHSHPAQRQRGPVPLPKQIQAHFKGGKTTPGHHSKKKRSIGCVLAPQYDQDAERLQHFLDDGSAKAVEEKQTPWYAEERLSRSKTLVYPYADVFLNTQGYDWHDQ
ncbi:MAG: hypothetical protein H0V70_00065 [Ktedonobacteraceae bacterium]|nr:hypothetical protein [Ktedonobacteraceae bacterium]